MLISIILCVFLCLKFILKCIAININFFRWDFNQKKIIGGKTNCCYMAINNSLARIYHAYFIFQINNSVFFFKFIRQLTRLTDKSIMLAKGAVSNKMLSKFCSMINGYMICNIGFDARKPVFGGCEQQRR